MPQPDEPVRTRSRARGTRQAQALAAALESLPGFCSAQEIHAELRRKGEHVGLATVYRHLQALSEEGSVDAIRDASGEILYRQCETSVHHHHLTCRNCGRSVEVEGRAVEQWAEKVAAEAGFTDVGHTVELFGLCPQCAAAGVVKAARRGGRGARSGGRRPGRSRGGQSRLGRRRGWRSRRPGRS
jgi:Fur family ferric uptake transcriptional regulator